MTMYKCFDCELNIVCSLKQGKRNVGPYLSICLDEFHVFGGEGGQYSIERDG